MQLFKVYHKETGKEVTDVLLMSSKGNLYSLVDENYLYENQDLVWIEWNREWVNQMSKEEDTITGVG